MLSIVELQKERETVQDHLTWLARETEAHIKTHGGKILTSCHKCINLEVGVRADREVLADITSELEATK